MKEQTQNLASVVSINISKRKGVVKKPVKSGFFKTNFGLVGDAHASREAGKRQVSLLAIEDYSLYTQKFPIGVFAENLTTKGINLCSLPIGTQLKVGEVLLEIAQIGKECHTGCAISKIVGQCIGATRAVFARVLEEGKIEQGDKIIEMGKASLSSEGST